jgi:energy-coupling factor transporter ATP-binding protein EcfA2
MRAFGIPWGCRRQPQDAAWQPNNSRGGPRRVHIAIQTSLTEGLAPKLAEQVGTLLDEIARRGTAILLVEQKLTIALKVSRRLYVMGHGRIVFEGTPAALAANAGLRKEWLEV